MFKKKGKKEENEVTEVTAVVKKKKKIKKRYIVLGIVAVLIVVSVARNIASSGKPMDVKVKTIGYGELTQTLDTSGTVESEEIKNYFAETAARIQSLDVEPGTTVEQGQSLLTYDVEKLEQAVKQTELETKASDYGIDATVTVLNYTQQKAAEAAKDYDEAVKYVEHYSAMVSEIKGQLTKATSAASEVESLTSQLADAQKKLEEKPNSEKRQSKVKELNKALKAASKEAAQYDVASLNASLESCSADLAAYESLKAQYEAQKEVDPSISSQRSQQSVLREVCQAADRGKPRRGEGRCDGRLWRNCDCGGLCGRPNGDGGQ